MLSNEIKSDVNTVLRRYVEDFSGFDLTTFAENKAEIYREFGDRLIISKDIEIKMDESFKKNKMDSCVDAVHHSLGKLIYANGPDGFFENKIVKDLSMVVEGKTVLIKAGMKLSKAFKYFLSDYRLERNQTIYSKFLTPDLKGKICISIHPLDYLSMSMNTAGWSSCQSLDGDYGAGTLGLMNDSSTIVAYFHTSDHDLNVFEGSSVKWNSKKWRTLVHINPTRDLVLFSRQYPYNSDGLQNEVLSLLKEVYSDSKFWELEPATSSILSNAYTKDYKSPHYADIRSSLGSMNFIPNMSIGADFDPQTSHKIVVGNTVNCCRCGGGYIEEPLEYSCYDCSKGNNCCDCCGGCGFYEHDIRLVDGESICDGCYDEYYSDCESCGEILHNDYLYYFEEHESRYCESCHSDATAELEEDWEEE